MGTAGIDLQRVIDQARRRAEEAGVFGSVRLEGGSIACRALNSAEEAHYRLTPQGDRLIVSLDMLDRWQSESIESGLMHSGDKLEELLDEELAELGFAGKVPPYRHFRSDDKLFVFETTVPLEGLSEAEAIERAAQFLLGYEACFRQLGDMDAGDDGDD